MTFDDAAAFAGFSVVIWFIVGVVRALLPGRAAAWFSAVPARVWALVYLAALVVLFLAGESVSRTLFLNALNCSIAAIGVEEVRSRTRMPAVDELRPRDLPE